MFEKSGNTVYYCSYKQWRVACLQAAEIFGHALQTGQLGPVLQQFGVGQDAIEAASRGGSTFLFVP